MAVRMQHVSHCSLCACGDVGTSLSSMMEDNAEAQRPEYKCEKHHTTWESVAGSDTSIPQAFEQLVPRALPQNSRDKGVRLKTNKIVAP